MDDSAEPSAQPAQASEAERGELLRLCQRHGIGTEYFDIWGHRRVVPDHGLRALLRAMGVEAGDRLQVQSSQRAADEAGAALEQRSPLPPVAVFWQDAAPWILRLQAGTRTGTLRWLLAEEAGGEHRGVVEDFHVALPAGLPIGYHRLELHIEVPAGGVRLLSSTLIVVAPRRCYLPPLLQEDHRVWGPAVQLYALRSERNWGIGDFTDLAAVVRMCGQVGAALVGINPLHALFPHNPEHASPYAPSSRRFCNPLYIDVEAVADFALCAEARATVFAPDFQGRLRALRHRELVDYSGVAALKMSVLAVLYGFFRRSQLAAALAPGDAGDPQPSARARQFREFQAASGRALRQHALFETLQEHFVGLDATVWGWPQWPYAYRDPTSAEVAQFLREHLERVEFYEYLQWQAELQLAEAGRSALDAKLGVGLYQDLAVSIDRGGAEAWAAQDLYAHSASAGCPPDDFNLHGQDWGLLPMLPERLRARAYAPFIATLRANMRHAGALRIDHVMGLARLFWVPRGEQPDAGAYVAYPFEHLLAVITLESHRNTCMVIGEDLGTVPDEVRHAMERSGMLSYRVMYFSHRNDGEFFAPGDFPREALVTSSTHDLATLVGFWEGRDLELRRTLHLFPSEAVRLQQFEERKRDAARLLSALQRESLLPAEIGPQPRWPVPMNSRLAFAVQEYLGRAPSRVLSVQLEDIFGCHEQVNLPGTVEQYANWRRKLPVSLEQWERDGRFADLARRLAAQRRN